MSGVSLASSSPYRQSPITLQPNYFVSHTLINTARRDIDILLRTFANAIVESQEGISGSPFTMFKAIWSRQNWNILHLRPLDPRAEAQRFSTWTRLFLERAASDRSVLTQAASLFSLYVYVTSQPARAVDESYSTHKIGIPYDTLVLLLRNAAEAQGLVAPYVLYVLRELLDAEIFQILPHSSTQPFSPLHLPFSLLSDFGYTKKPGRHSKIDKLARAVASASRLEEWVARMKDESGDHGPNNGHHLPADLTTSYLRLLPQRRLLSTRLISPPVIPYVSGTSAKASASGDGAPGSKLQHTETDHFGGPFNPTYHHPDFRNYQASKREIANVGPVDILLGAETMTRRNLRGVEKYAAGRGMGIDNGWSSSRFLDGRRGLLDLVQDDIDHRTQNDQTFTEPNL